MRVGFSSAKWLGVWLWLLGLTAGQVMAELRVNGVGAYTQLSKEYYVVALYTEKPVTTVEQLQALEGDKRAVLKISTRSWSAFGFSQLWKRDLSINNDLSAQSDAMDDLLAFTTFPKANLILGDEIIVQTQGRDQTQVLLNGDVVQTARGDTLFYLIANVWVGSSPPSRQFRSDILAGQDLSDPRLERTLERMQLLPMDNARRGIVKSWSADDEARARRLAEEKARREEADRARRAAAAKEEAERQAAIARAEEASRRKAAAQAAAAAAAAAAAKAEAEARALAERAAKEKEAAAAQEEVKTQEQQSAQAEQAQAKAQAEAEKARLAAEAAAAQAAEQAKAEAEAQALAQELLRKETLVYERKVYLWKLQRQVYGAVAYPEWARQFGEEGDYSISFRLDAQGGIEGIQEITPSEDSLLGQALRSALERAAPFGALPEGMSPGEILSLDYAFRLRSSPTLPPKPVAPEGLSQARQEGLSEDEKLRLLTAYQQQVRSRIEAAIEYPVWAKNMRQTGEVEARIRIGAEGDVQEVQLLKSTRHPLLNQEVEAAATRAAPFDPIPLGLGVPVVDVSVTHEFKR